MVLAMKAIGNRINLVGGGRKLTHMAAFTKVNLKTINKMDMAHISQSMEPATKVVGRTMNCMDVVSKSGQIFPNMTDITKKARKAESALISGWMDPNTAGAGRTTKFQELV